MGHARSTRRQWTAVVTASGVLALALSMSPGMLRAAMAQAAGGQLPVSQATCDEFAHSSLLGELDCMRAGHADCPRTDLSTLFGGCSYDDEDRMRRDVGLVDGGPLPSEPVVDAAYARAHPARYPLAAFKNGHEGEVLLTVDVSAEGRALGVSVKKFSDYRDLDSAAMEWMRTLRFTPAMADGVPVVGRVQVPVRFIMGGRTYAPGMGTDIAAEPPEPDAAH